MALTVLYAPHSLDSGSDEGSYLRLIDFCLTQIYA